MPICAAGPEPKTISFAPNRLDEARHLRNRCVNNHVTVHAVDGLVADDLQGVFAEIEAIRQAKQCNARSPSSHCRPIRQWNWLFRSIFLRQLLFGALRQPLGQRPA